jgi:CubicO group peptidase (beta-lactamase class C family)
MQQALIVERGGTIVSQEYAPGFSRGTPHALYSGTKSFWGFAALAAQRDGVLTLDDRVRGDITVRMLLTMTAGYGFGGLGTAVPTFERAWEIVPKDAPGTRFTYGGVPLQVFGKYFAERLGGEPHEYLRERILRPANADIASWRALKDGSHPLPTGAFATVDAWLAYGRFALAHHEEYRDAFTGTVQNPRYGLCWWLAPPKAPSDAFYASGSGGQALYVIPSERIVAVRFGEKDSLNHERMMRLLVDRLG